MKKQKEIKISPSSLEDFIWMSYRYCIGSHTIAAAMHADTIKDIIQKNPDCMSDDRKAFIAKDIRREINTILHLRDDVEIINCENYDAYSRLLLEVSKHNCPGKLKYIIDGAKGIVYMDVMDKEHDINYDYPDLIRWVKLANYLDVNCHRIVVTDYDDKIEEHICYSYPIQRLPNKYEKVWVPLDKGLSIDSYINPDYIKEIKEL